MTRIFISIELIVAHVHHTTYHTFFASISKTTYRRYDSFVNSPDKGIVCTTDCKLRIRPHNHFGTFGYLFLRTLPIACYNKKVFAHNTSTAISLITNNVITKRGITECRIALSGTRESQKCLLWLDARKHEGGARRGTNEGRAVRWQPRVKRSSPATRSPSAASWTAASERAEGCWRGTP